LVLLLIAVKHYGAVGYDMPDLLAIAILQLAAFDESYPPSVDRSRTIPVILLLTARTTGGMRPPGTTLFATPLAPFGSTRPITSELV
jgi:hypothetical protein